MDKNTLKITRGAIILLVAFGTAAYLCLAIDDSRGAVMFMLAFLMSNMFVLVLGMLLIALEE